MLHDLTLEGYGTRLVPLDELHAADLAAFVDDRIWAGMTTPTPHGVDAMRDWITAAVAQPGRLSFAVLDVETGALRGSTSYYDLDEHIGRVEIGNTFYAPVWWGTTNNPACKYLLLRHAFEDLGLVRVAFRADVLNTRSVAAIERLGAVREGVLRSHRLRPDGTRSDSVYLSILTEEWPAVRDGLLARLEQGLGAA
ncbi:GNAT family N-acetyltransferase [Cellulomonas soli]|uniref:GNAT family N-acetyltransferase n=1 Tax=Cellulomonas soli TaxID=931535 RepID=UPI003F86384D